MSTELHEADNPDPDPLRWLRHRLRGRSSSRSGVFLLLSVWLLSFHGLAAVLTEFVMSTPGFRYPGVYCLCQMGGFAVLAGASEPSLVEKAYALAKEAVSSRTAGGGPSNFLKASCCGLLMSVSHGAGVEEVHLNYVFAVFCKSAKVPLILLVSSCFFGQSASVGEVVGSLLVFAGLATFGAGEKFGSTGLGSSSGWGFCLIAANLSISCVCVNLQQELLHGGMKQSLLLFIQYSVSTICLVLHCTVSGELSEAYRWQQNLANPHGPVIGTMLDTVLTYLGLLALYRLTKEFDATRCNAVCSLRKMLTFCLSFVLFPKHFSAFHAVGLALGNGGGLLLHFAAERHKAEKEKSKIV